MSEPKPFRSSPFGQLMGTRILESDRERGTIEIEYVAKPEFLNRIGTIAGGMISSMLDSVTGLVANQGLPEGQFAVHRELTVHYHAPGAPGRMIGRGEVVSIDGRDVASRGELFDASGARIASADARLRIIRAAEHLPS